MKLKIYSDIPCGVFIDGKQYVTPFNLDLNSIYTGQLTVLPTSPETYSGYALTFTVEEDRLRSMSGGAKGVSWGAGFGEIHLTPPLARKTQSIEVLDQQSAGGSQVTLYTDGEYKLMCEGLSFFVKDLPNGLASPCLKLTLDGKMCAVTGRVDSKNYLLALCLNSDNEWKIMHEVISDFVETTEKGVITKDVLCSMLRHEKKCVYKPFDKTPCETAFTPTINHEYIDEVIPYLFLECVSMGCSDAVNLLDGDLSIDMDGLKEFFSSFDTITSPPFGDFGLDVIAIYDSKTSIAKPDLYKFEHKKGKITNIIHLLTCY